MTTQEQILWKLQTDGGKPITLNRNQKKFENQITLNTLGKYAVVMHTPEIIPKHYTEVLVQVFTGTEKDIDQVEKNNDYWICDGDCEKFQKTFFNRPNFYHSEVLRLSKEYPVLATSWEITDENQLPAKVRIYGHINKAFLGMKVLGQLFLNPNWENNEIPRELIPDTKWIFQHQEEHDVEKQLARYTEYKQKAFDCGMIRPFLLLVSMHPRIRYLVADLMGIDLSKAKVSDKWRGDSHGESWHIISKSRYGIRSISDHAIETINPLCHESTWYHCLYRSMIETAKVDKSRFKKKGHTESLALCKNSEDETILALEIETLKKARSFHQKVFKKTSETLAMKVNEIMQEDATRTLVQTLSDHGIRDPELHRFIIEICVLVHFNNWKRLHKKKKKINVSKPLKVLCHAPKIKKYFNSDDVDELLGEQKSNSNGKPSGGDGTSGPHSPRNQLPSESSQSTEEQSSTSSESDNKEEEEDDEEIDDDEEDEIARDWKDDESYNFNVDILIKGINNQLRKGCYRPGGFDEKASLAGQGAKIVAKKGAKFIIAPIVPILVVPYSVGNFIAKHFGSDHATLWSVCVQLIIQRLVLACNEIEIRDYYKDLTEDYNKKQELGEFKKKEHAAWKKLQTK